MPDEHTEWVNVLKHLLRLYNDKRRIKNYLRDNKTLLDKPQDESCLEVDLVKKMKKASERRSQRDLKKTKTMLSSRIQSPVFLYRK